VGNVGEHLKQFGIGRRTIKEARAMTQPEGRSADNAANWRGGRIIRQGYALVYAPNHPAARPGHPHVQEHRLVMEKQLGRFLEDYEVVHHKDGNRLNNNPDNLEVKTRHQHTSDHIKMSHQAMHLQHENALLKREVARLKQHIQELEEQLASS
jgi:hypothetical protein